MLKTREINIDLNIIHKQLFIYQELEIIQTTVLLRILLKKPVLPSKHIKLLRIYYIWSVYINLAESNVDNIYSGFSGDEVPREAPLVVIKVRRKSDLDRNQTKLLLFNTIALLN